jgi:hypothetical protein
MPTIDVIGDIHGYADKLQRLLTRLGYQKVAGFMRLRIAGRFSSAT